jgi:hypothetical protein
MNENSNVVRLRHPDEIDDPLTNILRLVTAALAARGRAFPCTSGDVCSGYEHT